MAQFAQHIEHAEVDVPLKNARLGLLLWRIANGLIFLFFAYANYLMRTVQPSWPPPGVARLDITVPVLITLAIVLSSVSAWQVRVAMRRENHAAVKRNTFITVGLGALFFVGLLIACLQVPYSGPYSSIVLTMNVFHGLHVIVGLGLFFYALRRLGQGVYTKDRHWGLEASVVFWQFVDAMWVFFFLVIYIL